MQYICLISIHMMTSYSQRWFLQRLNRFSMCAGDFIQSLGNDCEKWDAIVTVFFVDTAANILDYIDTIHRLTLKLLSFIFSTERY